MTSPYINSPYMDPQEPKRLTRSVTHKMIGGVCAGLAEYLNVDPTLVRLVFVFLFLAGIFPCVLAYIISWMVIPPEF